MKTIYDYADALLYWIIVLIPFSIIFGPAFANILLGFTAFLFLFKRIIKKDGLRISTPLNLPFLLFVLAGFLSFKNSVDYGDSWHGIVKLLKYAGIFLICSAEIKDRKHLERIAIAAALGACLTSVDAFWQIMTGSDFIRGIKLQSCVIGLIRPTASFPNPNVMGVYLSAITPLIAGLAFFYYKGRPKIIMLAAFLLSATGLCLTLSRGSGLGLYVALLFMAIVRKNKAMTMILILILVVSPFVMPKNIKDWSKEVHYNPIVFLFNYDRLSMYKNTLNMIEHHPVVGVGINTFARNYHAYKVTEPEYGKTPEASYAHNSYLQMAGEAGLLSLFIFAFMMFVLFRFAKRSYGAIKDDSSRVFLLAITACLIAYLVNSMTETSLYYPRVVIVFWFLIGCLLSFRKDEYRPQTD